MTVPALETESGAHRPARLLLVTSNGAGMGHLTRLLSVAIAAGDRAEVTMFSMSVALPVVTEQGLRGEYCPSVERGWMSGPRWHGYLRDRLIAVVEETQADVVAFDGVAPYPGIGMARLRLPDVRFAWVRRGMWQPNVNEAQLSRSHLFDLIVEPGDLASAADRGPTSQRSDSVGVGPVSMLDVVDRLPRDEAAAAMGLDPSLPTILVTLGSGRLGDVAEPGRVVMETLADHPGWQIALTRAAIATRHVPVVDRDRIVELSGVYPLARYLNAFDAVVSAAGYNAVHEFVPAGIPTLLIPNTATRTDDQVARADQLALEGLALSAHPDSAQALSAGIRRLLNDGVRVSLRRHIDALDESRRSGGAAATADHLVKLAADRKPTTAPRQRRVQDAWQGGKEIVKGVLGTRGSNAVRRILRRGTVDLPSGRMQVRMVEDVRSLAAVQSSTTPLLLSDRIPPELIRDGPPVEHLLAGSSDAYIERRRVIAETYYDVQNEH